MLSMWDSYGDTWPQVIYSCCCKWRHIWDYFNFSRTCRRVFMSCRNGKGGSLKLIDISAYNCRSHFVQSHSFILHFKKQRLFSKHSTFSRSRWNKWINSVRIKIWVSAREIGDMSTVQLSNHNWLRGHWQSATCTSHTSEYLYNHY